MTGAGESFGELEGRVLTLFGAGDLDAALETSERTAELFPDRLAYTAFWSACIEGVRGEPQRALRALEEAVERSDVWWGREMLEDDPDLVALREIPSFDDLVSECERRGRDARAAATVEWATVDPQAPAARPATLVVLHGRTGNVRDLVDRWSSAADEGVTVIAVQSSQMIARGMCCWDDLDAAESEVTQVLEATAGSGDDVVLAGFSQGAGIAARMALSRSTPQVRGFVSIAPSFFRRGLTPGDLAPLLPDAARVGVRGWMAIGERDERYRPGAEVVAGALDRAGVPTRWAVVQGRGHEYPEPFSEALAGALAYVLGRAHE